MTDVRKLASYHRAYRLCLAVYEVTVDYPSSERFGLVSQMRRASSSVGANIAEGSKRHSDKDQARFVGLAIGSLEELKHFLRLSADLRYLNPTRAKALCQEAEQLVRMLHVLRKHLLGKMSAPVT